MVEHTKHRTLDHPGTPPVRIPEAYEGLQVNCCRNPDCPNYGKADPEGMPIKRGRRRKDAIPVRYLVANARPDLVRSGSTMVRCKGCGEGLPLKSNQGIMEEYRRMLPAPAGPQAQAAQDCCTKADCENHHRSASEFPKAYRKFGYQTLYEGRKGNPRRQCKACKTVFTLPGSVDRRCVPEALPSEDVLLLKLLVGKMPLRRIRATLEVSPKYLYTRIAKFADHFRRLTEAREAQLPKVLAENPHRLEIGSDRQEYTLNWKHKEHKKNVRMIAVVSADNRSGYVFGPHPNFDPSVNPEEVDAQAKAAGDFLLAEPYRRHARFWLEPDYLCIAMLPEYQKITARGRAGAGARQSIRQRYEEALMRINIEEGEASDSARPSEGMLVHSGYTLYAHFLYLRKLLGNAKEVGFYLDQDAGMRAACLSIWGEQIRAGHAHAFYLRYNKHLTVEEKKMRTQGRLHAASKQQGASKWQALREKMKTSIRAGNPQGPWRDRWVRHPHTSMFEPEKELALLTPFPAHLDEDAIADRYLMGSLHAASRFCMQVRRMLSLFERPILSSKQYISHDHSVYSGYAPYSPTVALQVLEVFRGYYNYCKRGEDGRTPAMRLGLAERIYSPEEVLGADIPAVQESTATLRRAAEKTACERTEEAAALDSSDNAVTAPKKKRGPAPGMMM